MPYRFGQLAAISNMISRAAAESEQHAKMRVEDLVRAVHATHAGRPVAEVDAELRRRFAEQAIEPREPAFSELVQAIAAGEPV